MIALDEDSPDASARRRAWVEAVAAVLAKEGRRVDGDPAAALDGATVDGITVPALAPSPEAERTAPGVFPYVRGAAVRPDGWDVRSWVCAPDGRRAGDQALEELGGGATSLWLVTGGDGTPVAELDAALAEVHLDAAPVVLQAEPGAQQEAADALAAVLEGRAGPAHPRTSLGVDLLAGAADGAPPPVDLAALLARAGDLGVRALVVDATVPAGHGAGEVDTLAHLLAAGADLLRAAQDAGADPVAALAGCEARLPVTVEQHVSVATLRAARLLWSALVGECGIVPEHAALAQHAVTAPAMLSRYDAHTNLLRTTVAAFAAGVGGAESVTVLPFDVLLGRPGALGRRTARNISTLLLAESHVAALQDPAGGTAAVEALTDDLAAAAWDRFREIEAAGGIRAALADGSVQQRWAQVRAERAAQVRRRRRPLTGVSEFPQTGEVLPAREPWTRPLVPHTWAEEVEALRDDPLTEPVLIATVGAPARHTARAGFATNLCAAVGVPTVTVPVEDAGALAQALAAGSGVAVLAGSDEQYEQEGPDLVRALREAGARRVVLAGRPSPALAELVDDHLAAGQDVVEVGTRLREQARAGEQA